MQASGSIRIPEGTRTGTSRTQQISVGGRLFGAPLHQLGNLRFTLFDKEKIDRLAQQGLDRRVLLDGYMAKLTRHFRIEMTCNQLGRSSCGRLKRSAHS